MMNGKGAIGMLLSAMLLYSAVGVAGDIVELKLFFGLSIPGGGVVTEEQWRGFERTRIATSFEGFDVVDSTGYYKGEAEGSKLVILVIDEEEVDKAKALAALYAEEFRQDSVMVVKVPVLEWDFVGAGK